MTKLLRVFVQALLYFRAFEHGGIDHMGGRPAVHHCLHGGNIGGANSRHAHWKLVALKDKPWELYNLAKDRTETRDLAAKHPERVEELSALWQSWAERARVLPRPKPRR